MAAESTGLPATGEAGGGQGGGLVPSKTKLSKGDEVIVSLGASAVAERRVSRLKKSVWASGKLHGLADKGQRAPRCWFVTLTYRGVSDWRADHIRAAVQSFRLWCKRQGVACRYTWVAELQKRGAVHYHLLAWLPRHLSMPKWDRGHARSGAWWPHGMTNTQVAKAGVGYLMKYLSKLGELTRFPKGLRLYGIGGLSRDGRAIRSWLNLPEWCKRLYGVGEVVRSAGRLVVRATAEVLSGPYTVRLVPGGLVVRLTGDLAERFHEGPWSAFPVRS